MMLDDTIAAISTPIGEGGIGIVRISGRDSISIASKIFKSPSEKNLVDQKSHTIHYGKIIDPENGKVVDEVLVMIMKAPKTYTKEDIVEINCHGGVVPLRKVLDIVLKSGARLADPGEFTKRAFLNGRIDLSQAEAVIDMIRAKTEIGLDIGINQLEGSLSKKVKQLNKQLLEVIASIEASIDFPEHDIEHITIQKVNEKIKKVLNEIHKLLVTADTGKIFKEGLKTIIVGKPNVGKSSLLNALLEENRAIVTDIPGTTRDIIEEYINIKGIPLKIIDTAGIRETEDKVEQIGVEKTKELFKQADLLLIVLDASDEFSKEDELLTKLVQGRKSIVLINKTDLPQKLDEAVVRDVFKNNRIIKISVKENLGLEKLKEEISDMFFEGEVKPNETTIITNIRHKDALRRAKQSLEKAEETINMGMPLDCVSIDVTEARNSLGEITGDTVSDDVLDQIFTQFCIGK